MIFKHFLLRILNALNRKSCRELIWQMTNHAPVGFPWTEYPYNIIQELFKIANRQTALYVYKKMLAVKQFDRNVDLLRYSVQQANQDGLFLEFGVHTGTTINIIASILKQQGKEVHGFDSFQGLPERWEIARAGLYSTQGVLPKVENNVRLHVGLFQESIPPFLLQFPGHCSFIHIDSDLYSSAKTVLTLFRDRIMPGTIIQFDEYFNYPGWKNHEFKAFQEYVRENSIRYEYMGYCPYGYSVAVRIV